MKTLQECSWKEFAIGDFFDVTRPISRKEDDYKEGNVRFVASGGVNNGVTKFCQPKENEILDKGNCITVSPVDGSCYYQATDFLGRGGAGSSIILLYPKCFVLNNLNALFISQCINKTASSKYSYGLMASIDRIKKDIILFPVTPDGTPDWQFMEDYMREVEKKLLSQALPILQERISKSKNISGGVKINKQSWKEFALKDVFATIQRGKRLKTDDHIAGDMPYVSSSAVDNGVDNFISNTENVRMFGDCLTLANSGSVGATFYHPYTFVASDHVTKLQSSTINKYAYLFIATIVARLGEKYGFNREINDRRISRETILLPATPAGTPDYDFMETYMRERENRELEEYISIAGKKGIV